MRCQLTDANIGDIRAPALRPTSATPVRDAEGTQTDCKDSYV